jgi:ribosomal-protein-serine acetyltransferase
MARADGHAEIGTDLPELILRPLSREDAADYYELIDRNRDHLTAFGDYEEMRDATLTSVADDLAHGVANGDLAFGVWLGGDLIGRVDLVPRDAENHVLGYWLDSHHTGRGYATAACASLVALARSLGATDVWAGVTHGNVPSERVLKRLEFERVADIGRYTRFHRSLKRGTSNVTIERAQPSDAGAVVALLDAAADWQQRRGLRQWTPGTFGDEVTGTIAEGTLFVGRRDGALIGCFMLDDGSSRMARWLIDQGREPTRGRTVGRLTVTREASGQGLGVALLEAAGIVCARQGGAFVWLDCPAENARLRRYYEAAGFSYRGDNDIPGPNGEAWVTSVFERLTEVQRRPNKRIAYQNISATDANSSSDALT